MQNKRRHPRFTVEGVQGKMVFASHVEILNLSLGGVALRVDRRLNIGQEYTLKLEMGSKVVDIKGSVVWSVLSDLREEKGERVPEYSAGLRFQGIYTKPLEGLMGFIDEHKIFEEHRLGGLRFQIDAPGKAVIDTPEHYKVRLVSRSGMLIETERSLEPDVIYPMEILPPGRDPIRFKGRVASFLEVLDETPRHFEIGIEFLEMAPEDEERLERFIVSVSRPAGPRPIG